MVGDTSRFLSDGPCCINSTCEAADNPSSGMHGIRHLQALAGGNSADSHRPMVYELHHDLSKQGKYNRQHALERHHQCLNIRSGANRGHAAKGLEIVSSSAIAETLLICNSKYAKHVELVISKFTGGTASTSEISCATCSSKAYDDSSARWRQRMRQLCHVFASMALKLLLHLPFAFPFLLLLAALLLRAGERAL